MGIERGAFGGEETGGQTTIQGNCLGCTDCNGACWQALEMQVLPETVLKNKGKK